MKTYYVYILASRSHVLYVGVTNDLERRIHQHKTRRFPGFSAQYNCDRLVWYESFTNVKEAIACEKRIQGWRREKKLTLIAQMNPTMADLSVTVGSPQLDSEIPRCARDERGSEGSKGSQVVGVSTIRN